jgi:hypothetical protein
VGFEGFLVADASVVAGHDDAEGLERHGCLLGVGCLFISKGDIPLRPVGVVRKADMWTAESRRKEG